MTVHQLPIMRAWRRVYRTESIQAMALISAFAQAYEARRPLPEPAGTVSMFLAFGLSDLATAYMALNDWLAGHELRGDEVLKFDATRVPIECGVDWLDLTRRQLLERREAAGWLMRYALQESGRRPLEEPA